MVKFDKDQATLEGSTVTEQQWQAALLRVDSVVTRCPFCHQSQNLREMCFPNESGNLAARRRCKHCNRSMESDSATVFLRGALEYGRWAGRYAWSDFWKGRHGTPGKVDHDEFVGSIERLHAQGVLNKFEFWKGYREVKPKTERQEAEENAEKKWKEYEGSFR